MQTLINVFLRIHDEVLMVNHELRESLQSLRQAQSEESNRLLELVNSSMGALGFIRDVL